MNYSFVRYLEAKTTVDDRSLNSDVWQALAVELPARPLQILEVGAGIGTMASRLAKHQWPPGSGYTAIDADAANVQAAEQRLRGARLPFTLRLAAADVLDGDAMVKAAPAADLLIAHAFLDLFDLTSILSALFALVRPGGLFTFTLNFDGLTSFEPIIDPALDERIVALYHRTMDERRVSGRPSGDSRSGRHLLQLIPVFGGEILAAGSSDWVVFPRGGAYPHDEAYFLHHILYFVETSLSGQPELDSAAFKRWLDVRHAQVENGELIYIAHQIDIAGRRR